MAHAGTVVPCNICENHQNAEFYCINCEEYICQTCETYHSKFKTTKSHQLLLISQASDENITKKIDVKKVWIRSTIRVKGNTGIINVIIPTDNNCTWVSASRDKHLTLIDDKGDTIKTSVTAGDSEIEDAKAYNNDILLTCGNRKVFRLSRNGTKLTIFSDLQPYKTHGLCVTNEMDVLVCLVTLMDNKVVRLGKNGEIIQTIQNDNRGYPLYRLPLGVTAVPSGEILVAQGRYKNIVCVNKNGQRLFTWPGQDEFPVEAMMRRFDSQNLNHDTYNFIFTDYNNHEVYALRKDGTEVTCLLDRDMGIISPMGVALSKSGQLLVGCKDGKIHVIEY